MMMHDNKPKRQEEERFDIFKVKVTGMVQISKRLQGWFKFQTMTVSVSLPSLMKLWFLWTLSTMLTY